MTFPDSGVSANAVALQFIREELGSIRTSMHDELSGLRSDIAELSQGLSGHVAEYRERVAVLEYQRAEDHGRIDELESLDKERGKTSRSTKIAITVAILSAALAWVPELVLLLSK